MNISEIEVDELRNAVDKAEKAKKAAHVSLLEAKEQAALLTSQVISD